MINFKTRHIPCWKSPFHYKKRCLGIRIRYSNLCIRNDGTSKKFLTISIKWVRTFPFTFTKFIQLFSIRFIKSEYMFIRIIYKKYIAIFITAIKLWIRHNFRVLINTLSTNQRVISFLIFFESIHGPNLENSRLFWCFISSILLIFYSRLYTLPDHWQSSVIFRPPSKVKRTA